MNNFSVDIPKELKFIKSKLLFGLTKRQLIGFTMAIVISFPIFWLVKDYSLDLAMYATCFAAFPFLFGTLYKKHNMVAETWIRLYLENKLLFHYKRRYKMTKKNKAIANKRGFIGVQRKFNDTICETAVRSKTEKS